MKKTFTVFITILLTLGFLSVNASALEQGTTDSLTVSSGCHSLDAASAILGPEVIVENCKAAILYETETQTLLYASNPDERLAPSSLVKILTALIAVEESDLDDAVTVTQAALDSVPSDALKVDLQAGEVLSLRDLLHCLLTGSGNDAAAVIAHHISGSGQEFVNKMNAYALKLGCTNTNFVNEHGLHHEEQYTSARDAAKILAAAVENQDFLEVFTAIHYTVPANDLSQERALLTNNFMVHKEESEFYFDSRVLGGRTGVTEIGERNIATYSKSGDMSFICVILGARSQVAADGYSISRFGGYYETTDLLDAGSSGYKSAQILYAGQALRQYDVLGGDSALAVGPDEAFSTLLPESVAMDALSYRFSELSSDLKAPVKKGSLISSVQIWHNDLCVGEADLYALNDVKPAESFQTQITHKNQTGSGVLLLVLLGMSVITVLTVIIIRVIRRRKEQNGNVQESPRRRNRRRTR